LIEGTSRDNWPLCRRSSFAHNGCSRRVMVSTAMVPEIKERQGPALPQSLTGTASPMADLLGGENRKIYAVAWLGSAMKKEEVAHRASPLTYVRKDNPPIITTHGNADDVVPYVRLQQAPDKAGVPNQIFTIGAGATVNSRMKTISRHMLRSCFLLSTT
jgi:hypothetical protein